MNKTKYILLAAISLDGKIAKNSFQATSWTSPEDKKHLRKILDKCDVIIVGNNTYKTSIKPLAKRNCLVFTRKVSKIKIINNKCVYINSEKNSVKKYLAKNKYKKIAVLGGAQIYSWALKNKMINELYVTIEPVIFGKGLSLFDLTLKKAIKFKLVFCKKLNNKGSVLLKYKDK